MKQIMGSWQSNNLPVSIFYIAVFKLFVRIETDKERDEKLMHENSFLD